MASLFGNSAFLKSSSGASGATRVIRLADILLKQNTNDEGDPAPEGIQSAIAQLTPYADNLQVQSKILTLQNKLKDIQAREIDSDSTLAVFKKEVTDAMYNRTDSIRDIGSMAFNTSIKLDDAILSLDASIASLKARGKSTDSLKSYRAELSKLADAQRDLVNKFNTGTADPDLNGYGYYVHTNPADGSILGAAILPVALAPEEMTKGLKRIQNTTKLGNSTLPVYVSANQLADGTYEAKIGQKTWTGDGNLLVSEDDAEGDFDISDKAKFPLRSGGLSVGQFGRIVVGQENGAAKYAYFFKAHDNSVRQITQEEVDKLAGDPYMSRQLSGYVPLLSPDDVSTFKDVKPFDDKVIKTENLWGNKLQADADAEAANKQMDESNNRWYDVAGDNVRRGLKAVGGFFSNFGGGEKNKSLMQSYSERRNTPTPPQQPKESTPQGTDASAVIDKGKGFFRNVA